MESGVFYSFRKLSKLIELTLQPGGLPVCNKSDLSKLAVSILDLPASSVATEGSLKTHSRIHNNKTNCLINERAAKRGYIEHNVKLFKKNSNSNKN